MIIKGGLSGVPQPVMLLLWMSVVKMEHVLSIKPQHKLKLQDSFIRVVTIILKLGNLTDQMHVLKWRTWHHIDAEGEFDGSVML